MTKPLQAVNWNDPNCKFYDNIYNKQAQQFWLPTEIPVSDDKECWSNLDAKTKEAYERILAGLTLLDTNQTSGINKVAEKSENMFIQSLLALFGGFESIHARSYSTIFQTLCTTERINELFLWVEQVGELQNKVHKIMKEYNDKDSLYMSYVASLCLEGICFYSGELFLWVEQVGELQNKVHKIMKEYNDKDSLYMSYVASLCLEGICFYSGFFLPLYLAGQGKMIHSGEIINLILRDEKLHTIACGRFAQDLMLNVDDATKDHYKKKALELISEIYNLEMEYTELIYGDLGLVEEVETYVQFNVNYALECLGFESMFNIEEKDVNAIVLNGYSIETKTHDFFSTRGNGYVVATNVTKLTDEDFLF